MNCKCLLCRLREHPLQILCQRDSTGHLCEMQALSSFGVWNRRVKPFVIPAHLPITKLHHNGCYTLQRSFFCFPLLSFRLISPCQKNLLRILTHTKSQTDHLLMFQCCEKWFVLERLWGRGELHTGQWTISWLFINLRDHNIQFACNFKAMYHSFLFFLLFQLDNCTFGLETWLSG